MTDVSEILFEFISPDRLAIVSELSLRKQRVSELSKLSKHTVQECSRDLIRLSRAGFVRKDSNGFYEITNFGRSMLSLLPGLKFLARERNYFLAHDLSFLPQEFMERIGELSEGRLVNHANLVLDHIKEVVMKGREYVWLISDQIMPRWPGIESSYTSRNIPIRMIAEPTIDPGVLSEAKANLLNVEIGILPKVNIAMALNESLAGFCFPGLDGRIDFGAGFSGTDTSFRVWCSDLFRKYWSTSRKIGSLSEL
ncbi:MAG TPA: hypothetical protein VNA15_12920 [Candidatus Angelobacter sp.]|nr:hypothetical protein [Candidatus Angelobacter sp.]